VAGAPQRGPHRRHTGPGGGQPRVCPMGIAHPARRGAAGAAAPGRSGTQRRHHRMGLGRRALVHPRRHRDRQAHANTLSRWPHLGSRLRPRSAVVARSSDAPHEVVPGADDERAQSFRVGRTWGNRLQQPCESSRADHGRPGARVDRIPDTPRASGRRTGMGEGRDRQRRGVCQRRSGRAADLRAGHSSPAARVLRYRRRAVRRGRHRVRHQSPAVRRTRQALDERRLRRARDARHAAPRSGSPGGDHRVGATSVGEH
jgi:hypothetical protein